MKKIFFGLIILSALFTSCSNDDDNNGTSIIIPNAGTLSGGPFNFIAGDGIADNVTGISTDPDAIGSNRTFVITDDQGIILMLPETLSDVQAVNFDGAGAGTCLIWYLRYEDGLQGAAPGANANDLQGSFDLSNSISVFRNAAPNAGALLGGPFEICVDGTPDNVSGITIDPTAVGTNSSFVVTDEAGTILGLPPTLEAVQGINFDAAGPGVCLIWYLRYEDDLQGAEVGANANNLSGTFSLSNFISVTRNQSDAGTINGGPFNFTVDGTPDMVSGITLDGTAVGSNSSWVITDEAGTILGLPPSLEAVEGIDFDGAGAGVCLIWYLRYEDGLSGAEVGASANNLSGCFSLSNSISVTRQ